MTRIALAAAASIAAASAQAGSLDRSGQNIDVLFEDGNYAQLTFGYVAPDVDGGDLAALNPLGSGSGDVAGNYFNGALAYKQQVDERSSFALIVDQPYGADIAYPTDGSLLLGGTTATLNTSSLTFLGRYAFGNGFSVHGGARAQHLNGFVRLQGAAYQVLSGYEVDIDGDTAYGWQVGAAYERPEIALRVALTYFSDIEHDLDTVETLPATLGPFAGTFDTDTTVTTPEAVNLDFQTGVAPGTLVFGQVRYAHYSQVDLTPTTFGSLPGIEGASLITVDNTLDVNLGVGRQFTETFAGSVSVQWSDKHGDDLVSPLAPTDGSIGITLAGAYDLTEQLTLSGGINYTRLGDADPEVGTPDVRIAEFDDNDAYGIGFQIGYRF